VAIGAIVIPILLACAFATFNELQVCSAVIGLVGVAVIVANPFWGLIFFTLLLYTRPEDSIPALTGLQLPLIVSLVTLVSMLLQLMLNRTPFVRTPFIGMMVGFAVAGMLSGALAGVFAIASMALTRFVLLVLLILNLVRTPQNYRIFVTSIIVFTCYLAIFSIYLFLSGVATMDAGMGAVVARSRGTGIFSDPNDLAGTIIAGMGLALIRVVQTKRYTRACYIGIVALMLWAIVLTDSRGGLVALIVMLGAFCVALMRRKAPAIVLAALVAGTLLLAAPSRMARFDTAEESANSRLRFWSEGLTQFGMHPLTGVGYRKFEDFNEGYVAHNSFVTCFAELGGVAYLCWMGCIYLAYRRNTCLEEGERALAPVSTDLIGARLALLGYLVAGFWTTRTYEPNLYIFLVLPVSQQIAARGKPDLPFYSREDRMKAYRQLLALSIGMICLIRIMVERK
jgi:O-antigen ligase